MILLFSLFYFFSMEVPYLSGRVNDYANILDNETITLLEKKLADYEKETTNQVVILIIQSLEGENLEEFSIKTAEKWKLGTKEKDNGVLLLIALDDRKLRIEVGYGLEETLTDVKCGQIIRNKITPYFKSGNYKEGIIDGVDSIISVIGGKDNLDSNDVQVITQNEKSSSDLLNTGMDIFTRILFGFFIFGIIGLFTFIGIFSPKGFPGWFLYFFLIPFWAMFPIVVVGTKITFYIVITYLIGFPLVKILFAKSSDRFPGLKKFKKIFEGSGGSGSSFSSSSSSGSGSSSFSSSSSSSFSGGGGSFGGGGSSGSW
jgi:uncharacterized protein